MTSYASSVLAVIKLVQKAWLAVNLCLGITTYQYPSDCTITNASSYDFIIIGAGTAGSVVAKRLIDTGNYSVLVVEAGGDPPVESEFLGLFPVMVNTVYDYNVTSVNKNFSALVNGELPITIGKMLGGSSELNHGIMVVPPANDFDYYWANIAGDNWNYTNMLKYLKKATKLVDPALLDSSYASKYGDSGPMLLAREPQNASLLYQALEELGNFVGLDLSADDYKGYLQPLFNNVGGRLGSAEIYLSTIKDSSNLCLAKYTSATKILFNGTRAIGVEVTTSSGDSYVVYANKEVVLSAGAIFSPQLLMLSGIGPKEHLESLGIDVLLDLPVGQELRDHTSTIMVYQMESSTDTAPSGNYKKFPTKCITGYSAINSSQTAADYQSILLEFYPSQASQLQLTRQSFQIKDDICDAFYEASSGRYMYYNVLNLNHPKSTGRVYLNSTDPTDPPLVFSGHLTNADDLTLLADSIDHFNLILNTTYFKSINATWVNLGYDSSTSYAQDNYMGMWHDSCTNPLGKVLNPTNMCVLGTENLRVIDASAMPDLVTGNIGLTVTALGERGAEMIIEKYSGSS